MNNSRYIGLVVFLILAVFITTAIAEAQFQPLNQSNSITTRKTTKTTTAKTTSTTTTIKQSPNFWAKGYVPGKKGDNLYFTTVKQTSDAGYIAAGFDLPSTYYAHAVIFKLDSYGNVQWEKSFAMSGGSPDQVIRSIQQTSDGGYVFAGATNYGEYGSSCNDGSGNGCAWVVKLDSNGNVQWQKSYIGAYNSGAFDIKQTSSGGYVVAGVTNNQSSSTSDAWVAQLNSSGNLQWQRRITAPTFAAAYSVVQSGDGNYLIAGETGYYGSQSVLLVKLDTSGKTLWQKSYGQNYATLVTSIQQTSDNGYILSGTTNYPQSNQPGTDSLLAMKFDSSGNIQWQKQYYGGMLCPFGTCSGNPILGTAVIQTSDGGYAFGGNIGFQKSNGLVANLGWVLRTDSAGGIEWQRAYGGGTGSTFSALSGTKDGGFVVAGYSNQFSTIGESAYVVKTDSNGLISGCKDVHVLPDNINTGATIEPITLVGSNSNFAANSMSTSGLSTTANVAKDSFTTKIEC